MFVSEEGSPRVEQMKARNSVLLAFYEAVHLNRNDDSAWQIPKIVDLDTSYDLILFALTRLARQTQDKIIIIYRDFE